MQIGPKIRVGGTLGKVGEGVKKGVVGAGHAIGKVADNKYMKLLVAAGLAATGVGAGASAGIMGTMGAAGGAMKKGGGLMPAVSGGAKGAAMGYGAGKFGEAMYGGVGKVAGEGTLGSLVSGGARATATKAGGLLGTLKKAGSALGLTNGAGGAGGEGGAGMSLLDKLLLGGTAAAGAADEVDKRKQQGAARKFATDQYAAKAPIRARGMAMLTNPAAVDPRIAAASADPGNVYDRARRARMLAAGATAAAPPARAVV